MQLVWLEFYWCNRLALRPVVHAVGFYWCDRLAQRPVIQLHFVFAGCVSILAQHDEVQRALRAEINNVLGPNGFDSAITSARVEQLQLARCVVKESMRLSPAVPLLGRGPKEDIIIDGKIRKITHLSK